MSNFKIMKAAFVQFEPAFGEKERNINRSIEIMKSAEADIFVLPELCFTGYAFNSRKEAEYFAETVPEGESISKMKDFAKSKKAAIAFGLAERVENKIYNACVFIGKNGEYANYRKIHLFQYEKLWFDSGAERPQVIEYQGNRFGMMICFDWIFPEISRRLALEGAQIILHPANLVLPYCQDAMVTRSIENRVFSITANRIGVEKRGPYNYEFTGKSQIISPQGVRLKAASQSKEEIGIADINIGESDNKSLNEFNNIWDDRHPELY